MTWFGTWHQKPDLQFPKTKKTHLIRILYSENKSRFFIYIIFCLKNKTALQFLHQNLQIFFPSFGILLFN